MKINSSKCINTSVYDWVFISITTWDRLGMITPFFLIYCEWRQIGYDHTQYLIPADVWLLWFLQSTSASLYYSNFFNQLQLHYSRSRHGQNPSKAWMLNLKVCWWKHKHSSSLLPSSRPSISRILLNDCI